MTPSELLRQVATLPRTGWALRGIPNCESVGDHSVRVAMIAFLLCLREPASTIADQKRECRAGLLHDFRELVTGDLTPLSLRTSRITSLVDSPEKLTDIDPLGAVFKAAASSHLTKVADSLELFFQAQEYARVGYSNLGEMLEFQGNISNGFVRALVEQILSLGEEEARNFYPQTWISEFYDSPDYYLQMLAYDYKHGNCRTELINKIIGLSLLKGIEGHFAITDIGCGTANLGLYVASKAQSAVLTRLDINKDALRAVPSGQLGKIRVRNYLADFSKRWPVSTKSQDLVILAEVLEHIFNPGWLVQETARVLKPGGRLLVTVPNAWHWRKVGRFLFNRRLERTDSSDHIRYFSRRTLIELIQKYSFSVDRVFPFSLRWAPADSVWGRLHRLWSRIPGCAWNYFLLASLDRPTIDTPNFRSSEDAWAAVQFLGSMQRGKRLQFSQGNQESIFQTGFRIAALALVAGPDLKFESDAICAAAVLRTCIEALIGEYATGLRANLSYDDLFDVLQQSVNILPEDLRTGWTTLFQDIRSTAEWEFICSLFKFEEEGARVELLHECFREEWHGTIRRSYGLRNRR